MTIFHNPIPCVPFRVPTTHEEIQTTKHIHLFILLLQTYWFCVVFSKLKQFPLFFSKLIFPATNTTHCTFYIHVSALLPLQHSSSSYKGPIGYCHWMVVWLVGRPLLYSGMSHSAATEPYTCHNNLLFKKVRIRLDWVLWLLLQVQGLLLSYEILRDQIPHDSYVFMLWFNKQPLCVCLASRNLY